MKRGIFLLLSFFLNLALFAQSGDGHDASILLSYTPSGYASEPYMRQDASFNSEAKNTINNRSSACDLFVNFTFDTSDKNVYLVYTVDGTTPSKSNGSAIDCSFSNYSDPNRTFAGQISSENLIGGTTIKYIFYISDGDLSSAWGRVAGNSGYSTSWTEGDDNYSFDIKYSNTSSGGNWSSANMWVNSTVPNGESYNVELLSSVSGITLNQNITLSELKICTGANYTTSDDNPRTLTISKSESGSSITLANNGTWSLGLGTSTVVFTGAPSSGDAIHETSGNITFQNVIINKTSGSSNMAASFGTNSTVTGTLEIGNGGYISSTLPSSFYGSDAILKFNQGSDATYNVNSGDYTWSSTEIPNNISITSGTVVLNTDRTASGDLLISGGSMEIDANLTVNGIITNSAGDNGLVIISDNTNTGSLKTEGTVTGNIAVQRYISASTWGTSNDGWHLLSSPVASQTISGVWTPDGLTSNDYDFYAWDETTNFWLNQKDGDNTITTFETGKGYLAAYQAESTNTFTGSPNNADVLVNTLSRTTDVYDDQNDAGFNLVGNPYPCAIKWNDGNWTYTNISTTAKIWDNTSKSYIDLGANGIIPSMNGFMIQLTTGTTGSITIPKVSRTHDATAWHKSTIQSLKLVARQINNQSAQTSIINLNEESSNEYSPNYDSHFLPGYAPLFYSIKDNNNLSTNTIPSINETTEIPFGFVTNGSTNFQIELVEANIEYPVYLTDKLLGVTQKLSENPVYAFTSEEGDNPNRFEIHFGIVGINETTDINTIQVYSSNNSINIINNQNLSGDVNIINIVGQTIGSSELNGNTQQQIGIEAKTGVYIVNIRLEDGSSVSQKVILSK